MAYKMGNTGGSSPLKRQKLSPAARRRKAARDKAYAMGKPWEGKSTAKFKRKAKKAENQRIGQRSDSDIHHVGGKVGATKRVSRSKNRAGTRTEAKKNYK